MTFVTIAQPEFSRRNAGVAQFDDRWHMAFEALKRLNIREIRRHLAQLDELVRREGEVLITRRGKPIARVLPVATERMPQSHAALRATMPRLRVGSERGIRDEREER